MPPAAQLEGYRQRRGCSLAADGNLGVGPLAPQENRQVGPLGLTDDPHKIIGVVLVGALGQMGGDQPAAKVKLYGRQYCPQGGEIALGPPFEPVGKLGIVYVRRSNWGEVLPC